MGNKYQRSKIWCNKNKNKRSTVHDGGSWFLNITFGTGFIYGCLKSKHWPIAINHHYSFFFFFFKLIFQLYAWLNIINDIKNRLSKYIWNIHWLSFITRIISGIGHRINSVSCVLYSIVIIEYKGLNQKLLQRIFSFKNFQQIRSRELTHESPKIKENRMESYKVINWRKIVPATRKVGRENFKKPKPKGEGLPTFLSLLM